MANKLEIQELMYRNFLNGKRFSYGSYTGQSKALRKLAIGKFGIEKVAEMNDWQIEKEFVKEGLIPMQVAYDNGSDGEMVYLVPVQMLDQLDKLSR